MIEVLWQLAALALTGFTLLVVVVGDRRAYVSSKEAQLKRLNKENN